MSRTLHGLFEAQASRAPGLIAIAMDDDAIGYGRLADNARRTAGALRSLGLGHGDRIAYLGKNDPRFFELLFAASMTGIVLVSLNWRLALAELGQILDMSEAKALFVGREFGQGLLDRGLPASLSRAFDLDGDGDARLAGYAAWRDGALPLDTAEKVAGNTVVVQLYTSGTTGLPKGVMITQGNLLDLWDPALAPLPEWERLGAGERSLMAMPLFHVAGISASLTVLCTQSGATLQLLRDFTPGGVIALLEADAIVRMCVVPAIVRALVEALPPGRCHAPSLRHIIYGASPMTAALLEAATTRFDCGFVEVYGLTETSGYVTAMPHGERRPGDDLLQRSAGRPLPGVELSVIGPDGDRLPAGSAGEVLIRSAAVMAGYFRNAAATAEAIDAEGWLHTGDAGLLTAEGYLVLKDRLKDMIISGGENIYPAEIENVLAGCPLVADVAVIGIPDERWGEVPLAFVVAREEADGEAVIAWARERLASYKAPRRVEFIEAIPRNPSGKILHRVLRAPFWEGRGRQI